MCVRAWHYSGKPYCKSIMHIGAFLDDRLCGVLAWGPGIDTRKLIGVIPGTPWDGYLELNRMAFSSALPRNSESRALSICVRLMRRHAPWLHWLVSFSDGAQSGSGTIYRAAGWTLTQQRENVTLYRAPNGVIVSQVGVRTSTKLQRMIGAKSIAESQCTRLQGKMRRYMMSMRRECDDIIESMKIPFAGTVQDSSTAPLPRAFDSTCPLYMPTQMGERPALGAYIAAMPRYTDPHGAYMHTKSSLRRAHGAYADLWSK